MPEISVIVPVYNVEKYLSRCLDSLMTQTFQDLEVIAIDDGSTDQSWEILQHYQEQYAQLRIYTQKNMGISKTRNRGICLAQGTYIAFVDSDDYVENTMYEEFYAKAVQADLDLTVCDYIEIQEKNQMKKMICIPDFQTCSLAEHPSLIYDINASPWNKLFKRSLFQDYELKFPENLKYEDTYVLLSSLLYAKRIGKVNRALINYIVHEGSETTVMDQRVFDIFEILHMINERYQKQDHYEVYQEYLTFFNINRVTVYMLQQVYQKDPVLVDRMIDQGYLFLDNNFPDWRKNKPFLSHNSIVKQWIKKHKRLLKWYVHMKR